VKLRTITTSIFLALLIGCSLSALAASTAGTEKRPFGKTPEGRVADLYTLTNVHGVQVSLTNYGATLVSLKTPDRFGKFDDVVLGYDGLDGYLSGRGNFGGTMGRCVNRISHGHLVVNGKTYALTLSNGTHHFHGGKYGFNKVLWEGKAISGAHSQGVQFNYLSKHGEEGYPGNLKVQATFTLNDDDELKVEYLATTDQDTVINLTNHSYYNLGGQSAPDVLGHVVMIFADRFTPITTDTLPTGEIRAVKGTPLDFRTPFPVGARIDGDDEQLKLAKGYDHNFVLRDKPKGTLAPAATLFEPKSGRLMEISTTEPGVQFYTANTFDGSIQGKNGRSYFKRAGLCLEPQHFPDSPNHPNFPSIILRTGEQYKATTIYKFSIR
jgi:aldose 1-epimerase